MIKETLNYWKPAATPGGNNRLNLREKKGVWTAARLLMSLPVIGATNGGGRFGVFAVNMKNSPWRLVELFMARMFRRVYKYSGAGAGACLPRQLAICQCPSSKWRHISAINICIRRFQLLSQVPNERIGTH